MLSKLKGHDFRITPQRIAVLSILAGSKEHPSVEEIYKEVRAQFPTTSLATVYKTVSLLKGLNEVLELGFPDGSNRYDGQQALSPSPCDLYEMQEDYGPQTCSPWRNQRGYER